MPAPDGVLSLADERFVSLATFRRTGEPVATPVWIARDADALVVTTPAGSGKIKRLRRDPRVTLRPCGRGGAVADGAPTVEGVAEVVTEPDRQARPVDVIRHKYGVEYRIVMAVEGLIALARRRRPERAILRITDPA